MRELLERIRSNLLIVKWYIPLPPKKLIPSYQIAICNAYWGTHGCGKKAGHWGNSHWCECGITNKGYTIFNSEWQAYRVRKAKRGY